MTISPPCACAFHPLLACLGPPPPGCLPRQEAGSSGAGAAAALDARLAEAVHIRGLLARNTEEVDGLLRALGGEYVLPEAGGDLLRDGAGVLPTGAATPHQGLAVGPTSPVCWLRSKLTYGPKGLEAAATHCATTLVINPRAGCICSSCLSR